MDKQWLYLESPMQSGPAVKRWQELLVLAGFSTDADGWFGPKTDVKTREAQAWLGVMVDGIVGPKTMEAMQDKVRGNAVTLLPASPRTVIDGVEVFDYRGKVPHPKNTRADWGDRWPEITGVVLHRTACVLGENPERYWPVNAHIGVTMGGRIILAHPWDLHIWHGHRPSLWCIGIEFDGNPEGYPGYHWKPGGGPHDITPEQVKAGEVLLNLLLDGFKEHGRSFKYVYAHRQASDQRECDPGWQCWQKIAVPWMEKTGAIPGDDNGWGGTTFGSGFQIPQSWDPRSTASFRVR